MNMPAPQRIGVTGARGMIGSRVVAELRARRPDLQLRLLVRHAPVEPAWPGVELVVGDLLSEPDCAEFVAGLDAVIHLAQSNSPLASDRHWPSDCRANFLTTLNLLDALRATGRGCHVVFASSGGAVYGHHPEVDLYDEELPCSPLSPYGVQKLAVEHYLRLGVAQGWLTACALRIANAYGTVLFPERRQGLVGVAVARHREGLPVEVFGSPETVRDYVHLDDVARGFVAALGLRRGFEAVNLGSGEGHSVAGVLELLGEVSGRPVRVRLSEFGGRQFALTPRLVLAKAKAARLLDWHPGVSLREGLTALWRG